MQELTLPEMAHRSATVPPRALALSLAALGVPVPATTLLPEWLERDGALLVWLPVLLPAFLLTYYRGWRGASLALAAGMAVLTLTQVVVILLDLASPRWGSVFTVVVILVSVCLGAGWLAELLHQERQAAEEAAAAKAAFLANMSHEIRTPLNGVLGMLELLSGMELTSEQRFAADTATTSARALLQVLDDILDLSKIEAGHVQLESIAFDLPKLVLDTARVLTPAAGARQRAPRR